MYFYTDVIAFFLGSLRVKGYYIYKHSLCRKGGYCTSGLPFPSFTLLNFQIRDWNKERGSWGEGGGGGFLNAFNLALVLPLLLSGASAYGSYYFDIRCAGGGGTATGLLGLELQRPSVLGGQDTPGVCCSLVPAVVLRLIRALMSCSRLLTLRELILSP